MFPVYGFPTKKKGRNKVWPELRETERREFFRVEGRVRLHYSKIGHHHATAPSETKLWSSSLIQPDQFHAEGEYGERSMEGLSQEDLLKKILESLDRLHQKVGMLWTFFSSKWPIEELELVPCLVNISGSGMRFPTKERFQLGDQIEVTLELPITPNHLIRLCGEVVHVLDPEPGVESERLYQTAIKFTSVCDADREKIVRYTIDRQYQEIQCRRALTEEK